MQKYKLRKIKLEQEGFFGKGGGGSITGEISLRNDEQFAAAHPKFQVSKFLIQKVLSF